MPELHSSLLAIYSERAAASPFLHLSGFPRQETQVRVALCQVAVTSDKAKNVAHAKDMIAKAAAGGANLVLLPVREGEEAEPRD